MSVVSELPEKVAAATPDGISGVLSRLGNKELLTRALRSDPRAVILHSLRLTEAQKTTLEDMSPQEVAELVEPVVNLLAEGKRVVVTSIDLEPAATTGARAPQQPGGGTGGQAKKRCHVKVEIDVDL